MKDSEVSKKLNKEFPLPIYEMKIEAVTRMVRARDPYRTCEHYRDGGGGYNSNVRMIPLSLPRVRWLDREEWSK